MLFIGLGNFPAIGQISDPFFEHVTYRGAFGNVDWTSGWANWNPQNSNYPVTTATISGDIATNTTWTSTNVYLLSGFVYVKSGVTLTIMPGTIIRGDKTTKGTLIVQKGGKLIAEGTQNNPIIFTSNFAPASRDYGDWGGIILCGKAQINIPGDTSLIEGGPLAYYGGGANPDNSDNSGSLKYLRIEFAGIPLQPNQEINGLTFGGVGNGTQIDYIQVSYCGDDSYEWFGGSVNAKHLISFRGFDDEFDTDNGFSGKIQFFVGLRDPNIADISGSNGFESDNDASGSTNNPQTKATFCNASLFGPLATPNTTINSNFKRAMHIRRNSALNIYNSVFAGWPTGLYLDGTLTQNNAISGSLNINNSVLAGMITFFKLPSSGTWTSANEERTWYLNPIRSNDTLPNNSDMMLNDPFNLTNPNFMPLVNSPLLKGSIWWVDGINTTKSNIENFNIYPNPASAKVNIEIKNTSSSHLSIKLYDIVGNLIAVIAEENSAKGNYKSQFDISNLKSGIYLINVIVGNESKINRLVVK